MMQYNCPHCHILQDVNEHSLETTIQCSHCDGYFRIENVEDADYALLNELSETPKETQIINLSPHRQVQKSPREHRNHQKQHDMELFISGYTIIGSLGRGGMGQVFHAKQESLGREVAIKILDSSLARNKASVLRFEKEAKAMVGLDHPNIVRVLDRGQKDQKHYLILEYVDGPSLRDILNDGKFTSTEALRITHTLARTMEYAHNQGVIHRDLKPENILYTSEGLLKVADFGLAAVTGESEKNLPTHIRSMTHSHVSMGTECYMAPEQRKNAKHVDSRADLYSMGVILFELITGKLPLPHLLRPDVILVPDDLELNSLIRRCLEEAPEKRFKNTGEFCKAIEILMKGEFLPPPVLPIIRDTIIDTPAVENPLAALSFSNRLSSWSKPVRNSVEQIASHISESWTQPTTKRFFASTAVILFLATLVGLFFIFSPKPPSSAASSKKDIETSWFKQPASIKKLSNEHHQLLFDFERRILKTSWGHHPRFQWKIKGNWLASTDTLEQNTYQHSFLRNHRICSASYKGHFLVPNQSKTLSLSAVLQFLPPKVPFHNSLLSLHEYLEKVLPHNHTSIRYPTIGIGFIGAKKSEISLLAYPRSGRIHYSVRVRGLKNHRHLRHYPISMQSRFQYHKKMKFELILKGQVLIVKIEDKIEKIKLNRDEIFPVHPRFLCRDAHCKFTHIKAISSIIRRNPH